MINHNIYCLDNSKHKIENFKMECFILMQMQKFQTSFFLIFSALKKKEQILFEEDKKIIEDFKNFDASEFFYEHAKFFEEKKAKKILRSINNFAIHFDELKLDTNQAFYHLLKKNEKYKSEIITIDNKKYKIDTLTRFICNLYSFTKIYNSCRLLGILKLRAHNKIEDFFLILSKILDVATGVMRKKTKNQDEFDETFNNVKALARENNKVFFNFIKNNKI